MVLENCWTSQEQASPGKSIFRILFVCTGNICRSPFAEAMLRQTLGFHSEFVIGSSGTKAKPGAPISNETRHLFIEHGLPYESFESRLLTPEILESQDLVICMAREHRKQVLRMAPNLLNQSFTLFELSRILSDFPQTKEVKSADDWKSVIALAAHQRSDYRRFAPHDDVVDPIGRGASITREMERQILIGVKALTSWDGRSEDAIHHVTETSLNSTGTGPE